jgi:hypothetical protein
MHDCITIQISGTINNARMRELEYFVGHRLYRKGTDPEWYVDFQDREMADMVLVNLKAQDYHARIMGDPQ